MAFLQGPILLMFGLVGVLFTCTVPLVSGSLISAFPGPILYPTNNLKKTNNETVGVNKFTDKVANNI